MVERRLLPVAAWCDNEMGVTQHGREMADVIAQETVVTIVGGPA